MPAKPGNAARPAHPYSVHPAVAMARKWVAELPAKTGRPLDEWIALIRAEGPPDEAARRGWLKQEHGLATMTARSLAERADGGDLGIADEDPEAYLAGAPRLVESMYAGGKAHLRPIFERLLAMGLALGDDAKACPCKTMVPLYRNHVFAQITPTTRARVDLGLAMGDLAATGRLIDTGGFAKKDRITHRIPIAHEDEIDAEVASWLKAAYDRDA